MIHVQGRKVKDSNCNNSATDYPISLKFCTEFDHSTAGTLQMYKCSRSKVKVTGSEFKVTA